MLVNDYIVRSPRKDNFEFVILSAFPEIQEMDDYLNGPRCYVAADAAAVDWLKSLGVPGVTVSEIPGNYRLLTPIHRPSTKELSGARMLAQLAAAGHDVIISSVTRGNKRNEAQFRGGCIRE